MEDKQVDCYFEQKFGLKVFVDILQVRSTGFVGVTSAGGHQE